MTAALLNPDSLRDPGEVPEIAVQHAKSALADAPLAAMTRALADDMRTWERAGQPPVSGVELAYRLSLLSAEVYRRCYTLEVLDDDRR